MRVGRSLASFLTCSPCCGVIRPWRTRTSATRSGVRLIAVKCTARASGEPLQSRPDSDGDPDRGAGAAPGLERRVVGARPDSQAAGGPYAAAAAPGPAGGAADAGLPRLDVGGWRPLGAGLVLAARPRRSEERRVG